MKSTCVFPIFAADGTVHQSCKRLISHRPEEAPEPFAPNMGQANLWIVSQSLKA